MPLLASAFYSGTMQGAAPRERTFWLDVGAFALIGLALRIAASQGSLWLDEAWSALLVHEAATPLGVLVQINHDNNHHLNSIWLLLVGIEAPPLLARALSIASGTAAILLAAAILRPQGRVAGWTGAALFALSPILVTMGSEARGYAPMLAALLTAILLIDRWLARRDGYQPDVALGLCCFLGLFSQLTMLFGIVGLGGWVFVTLWRETAFKPAIGTTLRLFLPSLFAAMLALGFMAAAAYFAPLGFQFGRYDPFDFAAYQRALAEMVTYTLGLPFSSLLAILTALLLVAIGAILRVPRIALYALLIVAFPVTLALLQAGNVGYARYYLVSSIALLMLISTLVGRAASAGRGWRIAAFLSLGAMLIGSIAMTRELLVTRRGDVFPAIERMRALEPGGAAILIDRKPGYAIIKIAAASRDYPLSFPEDDCANPRFLFAERFLHEPPPPSTLTKCDVVYRAIIGGEARGLSGSHWRLYDRVQR